MISVAMATYNSEKFVEQQLDSIRTQSCPPDELIICDDGSVDKTELIVQNFIEIHGLQNKWQFVKNTHNKKWSRNTLDCAKMTKGEIIFLCNDDDIWLPSRIETMIYTLNQHKEIKVLLSRYKTVVEDGITLAPHSDSYFNDDGKFIKINVVTALRRLTFGAAAMVVQRSALNEIYDVSYENDLPMDLAIAIFAAARNELGILNTVTMLRWIHSNNVSAPANSLRKKLKQFQQRIQIRKNFSYFYHHMSPLITPYMTEKNIKNLKKIEKSMIKRANAIENRNFFTIACDLFTFNPMMNLRWILADLYVAIFGSQ